MMKIKGIFMALVAVSFLSGVAMAEVFTPHGGTIQATSNGNTATISWEGLGEITHLQIYTFPIKTVKVSGNSASIDLTEADRFQLMSKGKWLAIGKGGVPNVKLIGVAPECSQKSGCALQVK